ncbi:MAG: hypothetical protein QOE62_3185 [Actinomycetota bacterium]|jgi:hypothetical protein|nr:hypothetical protein [Actinomycetota bacterium]
MFAATLSLVLSGTWAATPAGAAPVALGGVPITQAAQGVVVDVYVDGKLILTTGRSEGSAPLLRVSVGTHRVDIRRAAQPSTSPPVLSSDIAVSVGHDKSAVVHLAPNGTPEISVSPVPGAAVIPSRPVPVIVPPAAVVPATDPRVHHSASTTAPANPAPASPSHVVAGTHHVQAPSHAAAGTQRVSAARAGTRHAPSQRSARGRAVKPSVSAIRLSADVGPSVAPATTPDAIPETYSLSPSDPGGGTTGISSLADGGLAAAAAFINEHLIVLDILGVAALLSLSLPRNKKRRASSSAHL